MIEIKIPSPGESISEVELSSWFVGNGDVVEKDQEIAEIESDKATLTLIATDAGKINILITEGETVAVNSLACTIDTSFTAQATQASTVAEEKISEPVAEIKTDNTQDNNSGVELSKIKISPLAKNIMLEKHLSVDDVINGLHRLTQNDIETISKSIDEGKNNSKQENLDSPKIQSPIIDKPHTRDAQTKKMSNLRKKLSARLVAVKNETAMLTTFNEVDMSAVMQLRKTYQKKFIEKHDIKLGFMSLFTKAASIALQAHPSVNSMIDGDNIISYNYTDIAIAVQTPKGLMVPVIRDVQNLSLAGIEKDLKQLAVKGRAGKLSLAEMTGGTFTITNGGVFGSLMSTPIINPPQSGILGMHNILDRPVAINGKVEIRPMMYIALSYDHRVIDGKDSVGFLVKIKELIENPTNMLFENISAVDKLLDL